MAKHSFISLKTFELFPALPLNELKTRKSELKLLGCSVQLHEYGLKDSIYKLSKKKQLSRKSDINFYTGLKQYYKFNVKGDLLLASKLNKQKDLFYLDRQNIKFSAFLTENFIYPNMHVHTYLKRRFVLNLKSKIVFNTLSLIRFSRLLKFLNRNLVLKLFTSLVQTKKIDRLRLNYYYSHKGNYNSGVNFNILGTPGWFLPYTSFNKRLNVYINKSVHYNQKFSKIVLTISNLLKFNNSSYISLLRSIYTYNFSSLQPLNFNKLVLLVLKQFISIKNLLRVAIVMRYKYFFKRKYKRNGASSFIKFINKFYLRLNLKFTSLLNFLTLQTFSFSTFLFNFNLNKNINMNININKLFFNSAYAVLSLLNFQNINSLFSNSNLLFQRTFYIFNEFFNPHYSNNKFVIHLKKGTLNFNEAVFSRLQNHYKPNNFINFKFVKRKKLFYWNSKFRSVLANVVDLNTRLKLKSAFKANAKISSLLSTFNNFKPKVTNNNVIKNKNENENPLNRLLKPNITFMKIANFRIKIIKKNIGFNLLTRQMGTQKFAKIYRRTSRYRFNSNFNLNLKPKLNNRVLKKFYSKHINLGLKFKFKHLHNSSIRLKSILQIKHPKVWRFMNKNVLSRLILSLNRNFSWRSRRKFKRKRYKLQKYQNNNKFNFNSNSDFKFKFKFKPKLNNKIKINYLKK